MINKVDIRHESGKPRLSDAKLNEFIASVQVKLEDISAEINNEGGILVITIERTDNIGYDVTGISAALDAKIILLTSVD